MEELRLNAYIDSLPDDAIDRILTAQHWCYSVPVDVDGARCLIGHAGDAYRVGKGEYFEYRCHCVHYGAAVDFDRMARHDGLDAAVRYVKARAGLRTRLPASEPEPAQVAR